MRYWKILLSNKNHNKKPRKSRVKPKSWIVFHNNGIYNFEGIRNPKVIIKDWSNNLKGHSI